MYQKDKRSFDFLATLLGFIIIFPVFILLIILLSISRGKRNILSPGKEGT